MARPIKFPADQILDTAAILVGESGPAGLSVAGVSGRLGAPSGSIYHRFKSRDALAAGLWLRSVERFQAAWLGALDLEDPSSAACEAAARVLSFARTNLSDARILLLYRSSDLLDGGWPQDLAERNEQQRARVAGAIAELGVRLGAVSSPDRRRVRFAVVDIPYAAARGPLAQGVPPPPELDAILDDAVRAVISRISDPTDQEAAP